MRPAPLPLIVNDHWRLAIEEGCDFIHLGQQDLQTVDLARIRAAGVKLGLSTHDHVELETAMAAEPDYIALGPIYPTILKQMKWAPQGVERISGWKRRVAPMPLIAIGGLNPDRLDGVFTAGADSAMRRDPHVLVVGGSDSSGGAGIGRDIETISSIGLRTCLDITALTMQAHKAVLEIHPIQPGLVADQMRAALQANKVAATRQRALFQRQKQFRDRLMLRHLWEEAQPLAIDREVACFLAAGV